MSEASVVLKALPSSVTNASVSSPFTSLTKEAHGWSPYNVNEGSVLGLAGEDYCVVAGDTRMSDGYTILSRNVSKLFPLTSKCVLASAGMQADASTLQKVLSMQLKQYAFNHKKEMSCPAVAQHLSNTLYYKRFFPYYTFNIVAGVDEEGKGACFGYDAIGSFERIPYGVAGSASALITSILDNQVEFKSQKKNFKKLSIEEAVDLVKDVFTSAGERDIYTGDSVDIFVITKNGIQKESFQLKKD